MDGFADARDFPKGGTTRTPLPLWQCEATPHLTKAPFGGGLGKLSQGCWLGHRLRTLPAFPKAYAFALLNCVSPIQNPELDIGGG